MIKIHVLLCMALLLTACATAKPVDVQNRLNAWIGQDADALVRSWGPPDRTYDFRDGSRVLEYERNRIDTYGGFNRPYGSIGVGSDGSAVGIGVPLWMDEPQISVRRCLIKFETDKKRIVRQTSFEGPNCAWAIMRMQK